jgi:hypothetical protein
MQIKVKRKVLAAGVREIIILHHLAKWHLCAVWPTDSRLQCMRLEKRAKQMKNKSKMLNKESE